MPSFATDSPLDEKIKRGVVYDTLKILGLNRRRRYKSIKQKKADFQARIQSKFTSVNSQQDKKLS